MHSPARPTLSLSHTIIFSHSTHRPPLTRLPDTRYKLPGKRFSIIIGPVLTYVANTSAYSCTLGLLPRAMPPTKASAVLPIRTPPRNIPFRKVDNADGGLTTSGRLKSTFLLPFLSSVTGAGGEGTETSFGPSSPQRGQRTLPCFGVNRSVHVGQRTSFETSSCEERRGDRVGGAVPFVDGLHSQGRTEGFFTLSGVAGFCAKADHTM